MDDDVEYVHIGLLYGYLNIFGLLPMLNSESAHCSKERERERERERGTEERTLTFIYLLVYCRLRVYSCCYIITG